MAVTKVPKVKRKDYETLEDYEDAKVATLEKALKDFKRKVQNENILLEYRNRMYFISPGEKKRDKVKRGIKKARRRERIRAYYDDGM